MDKKMLKRIIGGVVLAAVVVTSFTINNLVINVSNNAKASMNNNKEIHFTYSSSALDKATVHLVNEGVFKEDYFKAPSTEYNHDLAILSQAIALASGNTTESIKNWGENFDEVITTKVDDSDIDYEIHRNAYIVEVYKQLGFYNDVYKKYDVSLNDNSNTSGYSIAMKDIKINNKKYKLVCANVRSVNYGSEWGSNFYLNDDNSMTGFEYAGADMYEGIKAYIKKHRLGKNTKIWIPAYSRGAGVANAAAALLDKDIEKGMYKFKKEDVYAYMCATPKISLKTDGGDEIYNNIFNTLIESDLVATVAPSYWGYNNRYGNVLVIPHLFTKSSDIKKISNGQKVDMPEETVELIKKVSKDYNTIRYENALNEDRKELDVVYDGFSVGPGICNVIDMCAYMFHPTLEGFEKIWQPAVLDMVPFTISQHRKYDETQGCWVKYDTIAEFVCINYGEDAINNAIEAGVFSQSEYNKQIEDITHLYDKGFINEDMYKMCYRLIDTFYGLKIVAYKYGVSADDIKGFVQRTIEILPDMKKAMTPLSGAVNCKSNHYGEYYMAWLQNYNTYTKEVIN